MLYGQCYITLYRENELLYGSNISVSFLDSESLVAIEVTIWNIFVI